MSQSEKDLIDEMIREAIEAFGCRFEARIDRALAACGKSPIERVLMAAIVFWADRMPDFAQPHIYGAAYDGAPCPFEGLHLFPQAPVDGYFLDFLFVNRDATGKETFVVVECDGHEFHERTKRQASHDKKRDRHFVRKGWKVLRYTGSDIWRDSHAVALEAFSVAMGQEL